MDFSSNFDLIVNRAFWFDKVGLYSGGKNKPAKKLCKIRKSAVALWKPWMEKWFIPHFKALNVSVNLKYQTLQKM